MPFFQVTVIHYSSSLSRTGWLSFLTGRDSQGREFVMGVYPMLQDETCFFLAADFDGGDWQGDAQAFLAAATRIGLPAALERSRSGNGGHAWFFIEEAVPAALARKLGSHILTETMEHRPELGLTSHDRLFPNQDPLPKGGFGNLIALPLQKAARLNGNSVFVDEQFRAYDDQWAFLASMPRISRAQTQSIGGHSIDLRQRLADHSSGLFPPGSQEAPDDVPFDNRSL